MEDMQVRNTNGTSFTSIKTYIMKCWLCESLLQLMDTAEQLADLGCSLWLTWLEDFQPLMLLLEPTQTICHYCWSQVSHPPTTLKNRYNSNAASNMMLLYMEGGPNTNDGHDRHLIHHTIGEIELYQSARCYEPVVAKTFVIRHIKVSSVQTVLAFCLSIVLTVVECCVKIGSHRCTACILTGNSLLNSHYSMLRIWDNHSSVTPTFSNTSSQSNFWRWIKCFPHTNSPNPHRLFQDAAHMIDEAIITALYEKKPVYLEIPVNINGQKIPIPSPISFTSSKRVRKTRSISHN